EEGEDDPDADAEARAEAPGETAPDLRRDRPGTGVRDRPADAEEDAADDVSALGHRRRPRDEVAGEERAQPAAPQEPDPDEAGPDGDREHGVEVPVLEQQHLPDRV